MKKLLIGAGLLLAAMTTAGAAMAQGYGYAAPGYAAPYGYGPYDAAPGYGVYDSVPGDTVYDFTPGYSGFGNNWYDEDRVSGPGRGNSAESQR